MQFNSIASSVENNNACQKAYFLDGPGGSGKTYLFNTLLSYVLSRGGTILPFATTGIAANLLKKVEQCTVASNYLYQF